MIEFFTAATPNGWKVSIMLEECGLPFSWHWIDIGRGEQFDPAFLRVSPNGKIPAIVDHDPADGGAPIPVFETGAILVYLADKTGRFLGDSTRERSSCLQWLFWQVGGLGPMLGQHGHFKLYAPDRIAYATDRYRREADRLYGVLDRQLADNRHVAGEAYTIADMACFPWIRTWKAQGIVLADYPHVQRWYDGLKERPALRQGIAHGADRIVRRPQDDPDTRKTLFGLKD